jgi:hypothetical protein
VQAAQEEHLNMPDVSGNETTFGAVAIDFSPGPEQWMIDAGVTVEADNTNAVISNENQSTLVNFGSIYSNLNNAVDFGNTSSSAFIINEKAALISGDVNAIIFDGNGATIQNFGGDITGGTNGIFFDLHARNTHVFNYGTVSGNSTGIFFESIVNGGLLLNKGSIVGDFEETTGIGVEIDTHPGLFTQVTNAKGATITGGEEAIYVELGNLDLVNDGILKGGLDIGYTGSTDTITNQGHIYGSVILNGAFEVFDGKGGTSGDIFAFGGHDVITAGNGNVRIHLGAGINIVTAGPGHDKFIFDGYAGGPADLIKHFNPLIDRIVLPEAEFAGLGSPGVLTASHFGINGNVHNHVPQIVYNYHNGFLYYDDNGDLPGGRSHFTTLAGHPPIGHGDFIVLA